MKLTSDNPMRPALVSVLVFEIVVFWLAYFGMIRVEGVSAVTATISVGAATVLAVAAVAGLRQGWGYPLGWATQLVAVGLGILTPWMFAMGGVFALIWGMSFLLGWRLENRQEQGSSSD